MTNKQHTQNSEEEAVQLFAKQMLQSRFFMGRFQEKRYVASLQSYRDVILISNEDVDLIRDLEVVKKRVCGFYTDHWVGITDPNIIGTPSGYAIWTELPAEIFGNYWYKITKLKFRSKEILLKLKVIRPVSTGVSLSKTLLSTEKGEDSKKDTHTSILGETNESISWFFKTIVTLNNTKEFLRFLSILFVTVFTGLLTFIERFGDFTIRFIKESSQLIHALTPAFLACINLIAKIVGGFYLLILSMWKTRSPPNVYQSPYIPRSNPVLINPNPTSNYITGYRRHALNDPDYRIRRFSGSVRNVKITPLD